MSEDFKFRALTAEDWKGGIKENTTSDDEGLKLEIERKHGSYTSIPLDSGIPGCCWNRVVLDGYVPEDSLLTVSFSTSETEEAAPEWSGKLVFKGSRGSPVMDALVQAPPGRYVRLKIDFDSGGNSPVLRQAKIYYPRQSYLRYLPAIYQENRESKEFLERFLSIFESSMFDTEEMISSIPMFFDPKAAPEEFYRWLADWVSLDIYDQLDENKKREYILRAVEFYKKKGTVSGIAELVSFLTGGKKCCVKEYTNNVFRSWGMEHDDVTDLDEQMRECMNYEEDPEYKCTKFYRNVSRTVDTGNPVLLSNMGKNKYCDVVHYTIDTGEDRTYSPHVIGIFIFLQEKESLVIDEEEYERQLHKIIDSFLPVFVRANIHIVVVPYIERYDKSKVQEKYKDSVRAYRYEKFAAVDGHYEDKTDWLWIYSFDKYHSNIKMTNNIKYRTHHSGIGVEAQL